MAWLNQACVGLGFLELSNSHKFESGNSCVSHDVIALAEPAGQGSKRMSRCGGVLEVVSQSSNRGDYYYVVE
jgi:hypothetical protein